jgi:hypothetical protein
METPGHLRELFRMQHAPEERIGVRTAGRGKKVKTKWIAPTGSASKHALEREVT